MGSAAIGDSLSAVGMIEGVARASVGESAIGRMLVGGARVTVDGG